MAYVEWHGGIQHHHKTERLASLLGVNIREAVGIRGCLYAWAIDNRPGGMVERSLISFACRWDGDERKLISSLIDSGLLDEDKDSGGLHYLIHDWQDYTKGYRKSRSDIERRQQKRDSSATVARQPRDSSAIVAGSDRATVAGNGTEQSRTERSMPLNHSDGVIGHLFVLSKQQKIAATESTLRNRLESWVARIGAQAVEEKLSSPSAVGRTVNELQDLWFPRPNGKPQTVVSKHKCGVCADTGKVAVGVKDGAPEIGDCSCIRRRVPK